MSWPKANTSWLESEVDPESQNLSCKRGSKIDSSHDQLELICWYLTQKHPEFSQDFSFLIQNNTVFYSRYQSLRNPSVPESSTTILIQGIYEMFPLEARSVLRNRIYLSSQPSEMCRGMIKLAAKRGGDVVVPKPHSKKIEFSFREISFKNSSATLDLLCKTPVSKLAAMKFARQLAAQTKIETEHFQSDRAVGSVLVSPTGQMIAAAKNSNRSNKTLHAEVNLLQSFFTHLGPELPSGAVLYTTLKPCKMCAGMIVASTQDVHKFHVVYDVEDEGPLACRTVLNAKSPEWVRYVQSYGRPPRCNEYLFEDWLNLDD